MIKLTVLFSRALIGLSFRLWPPPKTAPRFVNWLCRLSMRLNWHFIRKGARDMARKANEQ